MVKMLIFRVVQRSLQSVESVKSIQQTSLHLSVRRTYAKWASRKPIAIVNENELYDCDETSLIEQNRENCPQQPKKVALETKIKNDSVIKNSTPSKFTILKDNDHIITSLMTKVKTRKTREKNNEILLEGYRLIKDAIEGGVVPKVIIFSRPSDLEKLALPEDVHLYKVPYRTIQLWSNLTTSPGVMGIFRAPDLRKQSPAANSLPLTIICDNVREPGNLGTILRAAAGVGCERLLLMKGCVDVWEPKVLRSAAGAHFRLPIYAFSVWEQVPSLISRHSRIFVTDSNDVSSPMSEYVIDNLNTTVSGDSSMDSNARTDDGLDSEKLQSRKESPTEKEMMQQFLSKLPIVPYYSLDYTKDEVVLVVSGETEGLSFDSSSFLEERQALRINIPLVNGVDSLNTGVALGIVTFEVKRQFVKRFAELK